ncbi:MAG: hypothetical protein PHO66_03385, partial [Eubacteriales bacterium]|nr:hypothetical protein [Eubacteriales bacterium]
DRSGPRLLGTTGVKAATPGAVPAALLPTTAHSPRQLRGPIAFLDEGLPPAPAKALLPALLRIIKAVLWRVNGR